MTRIAVLALQGAFIEHEKMLHRLGVETFEVREQSDWSQSKDGLIIPGGESTVMRKLLQETSLYAPVREDILHGLPVFGTCAGLILLAREQDGNVETADDFPRLSTMDIDVVRNAYGRQLGSFHTEAPFAGSVIPMTFIRAPYIRHVLSPKCTILSEVDGHIVAARQANQLVTAFHPELTDDETVHRFFLRMT